MLMAELARALVGRRWRGGAAAVVVIMSGLGRLGHWAVERRAGARGRKDTQ